MQIDRSQKDALDQKDKGNRGPLLYAVAAVVLLAGAGLAVSRIFGNAAEVEVERPALEQGAATGNVVLTAGGYIVAHHPIDVSSKVVGKVAWVGVEKGDQVREGQVIVRLKDAEFVAQLKEAQANVAVLKARLRQLETGRARRRSTLPRPPCSRHRPIS